MRKETVVYPHKNVGVVRRWLVRSNEAVDEGQPLCEIYCSATRDLVTLPSPHEGTVDKIVAQEGIVNSFKSTCSNIARLYPSSLCYLTIF